MEKEGMVEAGFSSNPLSLHRHTNYISAPWHPGKATRLVLAHGMFFSMPSNA